jgi:hypothetical protein
MTNVKGNYKGGRSKELVKYTVTGAAKGRAKQAVTSGKKFLKDIGSKTTSEQRFLGKTIPKTLFKVAKFAFKNPITATAAFLAPAAIKQLLLDQNKSNIQIKDNGYYNGRRN